MFDSAIVWILRGLGVSMAFTMQGFVAKAGSYAASWPIWKDWKQFSLAYDCARDPIRCARENREFILGRILPAALATIAVAFALYTVVESAGQSVADVSGGNRSFSGSDEEID